jgi:hypothetical protein
MMSFRGQANWAKMTSPWGLAISTGKPPNQKVNKVEELTHLSMNIAVDIYMVSHIVYDTSHNYNSSFADLMVFLNTT